MTFSPNSDMPDLPGRRKVTYFEVTGSTNNDLVGMVKRGEAKIGDVVAAACQTAGRGRRGNDFASQRGGIYFSFAAQNNSDTLATVCAGVAVAKTLERYGYSPSIKWVNDVLIGGKKVCGILAEAVSGTDICVIGVGINVMSSAVPLELQNTATALDAEEGTLPEAEELTERIISEYEELCRRDGAKIIEEYRKYLSFLGKDVVIKQTGKVCTALGVTPSGNLEVAFPDGERKVLNSGEISIKIDR